MNPLLRIQKELEKYPSVRTQLDIPLDKDKGVWWLDASYDGGVLSIEYRPDIAFGLHLGKDSGYGSRPEEVYRSEDALLRRLKLLVGNQKKTIKFRELRELLGFTQAAVSRVLGQKQASVSRFESREDMRVSSLFRFVKSLGGQLEIRVHFEECSVPLFLDASTEELDIVWAEADSAQGSHTMRLVDVENVQGEAAPPRRVGTV